MSRLYDNQPLQNLAVKTYSWGKLWNPTPYKSGCGVIVEGTIQGRSRLAITDVDKNKFRYVVLHIACQRAHKRKFDATNKEIEPNFSETKKVSTGFLNSSYKVAAVGESDALKLEDLVSLICKEELNALTIISQPEVERQEELISFWIEENHTMKMELVESDHIRLRTCGDSPFIESIVKLDANGEPVTVSNYSGGEDIGSSWTQKIMNLKLTDAPSAAAAAAQGECAGDDEWDD
ncbi:arpin [Octopus bimaculoides]|uniref:Arpin n=1 Tax=Octopus bimaculoides TaxID=37653 RepID=A0A0L8FGB7_OCTBM|nr:arpin [Octopus bimaculoides]|eukprot:XP_014790237.1 PREDICTED: arpin-like [Octopus bimaculoides]